MLIKRRTFSFTLSSKTLMHPEAEIQQLADKLDTYGKELELTAGHKLSMRHKGEQVCYILKDGYLSLHQHESGTTVSYMYPIFIAGLNEIFTNCSAGYFRAESRILVRRVTYADFHRCLDESPELWRNITMIMSYTIHRLFVRDMQISTKNAYQIVRNLLIDLNLQPEKIKDTVSASKYILDRAPLSRSTVMHILSTLSKGEFILMNKGGILASINKLPEKF